ncbi:secreted protein containing DUF330 [Candidatus Magnetoovum chiemensis]|nr:secreted protein containing DUF330 [Candidatus Magnetoovum chiemensis]
MTYIKKTIIILLLALSLPLGCATSKERSIYSLLIEYPNAKRAESAEIGGSPDISLVIQSDCPQYLKQPYIAYRTSPYELSLSIYSQWEAAPMNIVELELTNYLLSSGAINNVKKLSYTPKGFYTLKLILKRFEMLTDENDKSHALLSLSLSYLNAQSAVIYQKSYEQKVQLKDNAFKSLAVGLSAALSEVIKDAGTHIAQKGQ